MTKPVDYLNPPGCAPAQGLYSHIGVAKPEKVFHIAGQLSVNLDGEVVGRHDFEAQYAQVFQNMRDVLNGVGLDFPNVVKFTTLFVRSQDIELFMKLRAETFPGWFGGDVFPPNTILVIDRLVKEDFLFEVEAVAQA